MSGCVVASVCIVRDIVGFPIARWIARVPGLNSCFILCAVFCFICSFCMLRRSFVRVVCRVVAACVSCCSVAAVSLVSVVMCICIFSWNVFSMVWLRCAIASFSFVSVLALSSV